MEGWRILGIAATIAISLPLFVAIVRANMAHGSRRAAMTDEERAADDAAQALWNQNR